MIIARSQYDARPVLASDLSFAGDEGKTKQSDLRDSDINLIFKRFEKTGQLPDMIVREPAYGDFSSVPDFQESFEIVKKAEEQFAALDVTIRNRFDNDPVKFLGFVGDPKNVDELARMGLLKPEVMAARKAAAEAAGKKAAEDAAVIKEADERRLIEKIKAELNK